MHISFYGIYGIENIKIINKYTYELQEMNNNHNLGFYKDSNISYHRMKDILNEIHDNNEEPFIYSEYKSIDYSDVEEYHVKSKHINWFVEHKCCWKDKQFRLDRYYSFLHDSPIGPFYNVIVVLKQVMYIEGRDDIRIIKFKNRPADIIQTEIPNGDIFPDMMDNGFDMIDEKSDEFQDAYIVVRK